MSRILREVVPPLATIYALVMAMILSLSRSWPPRRPVRSAAEVLVTIGAGYAAFLAIVLVFMALATGDETALPEAVTGGAALLGVALPAFALLSAADSLRRRRAGGSGSRRYPRER